MSDLYTVSQVAEILDTTPASIRRSIQRGTLKAEKIGEIWIIRQSDLDEFKANPPRGGRPKEESGDS